MSGSALNPWAIARDATIYARDVGKQLNCPVNVSSTSISIKTATLAFFLYSLYLLILLLFNVL